MYSIIVPIYNVEKHLPQCIESILAQTHKEFELILVDDGSPDNCPAICDEYAEKDERVKVIHKRNGGLITARKAGLEASKGEYICFVDGDDFVAGDMLETYENALNEHRVDAICTGYSEYYGEDKSITVSQKIKAGYYDEKALTKCVYPYMLSTAPFFNFYIHPSVCTKCYKKRILEVVYNSIPNDISLGEDVAATYAALLMSSSISVIDYTGYMYRQNPNSMTHTYDKNLYEKIRNLVVYLKQIEKTMRWKAGNQIDEYAVYLLILAKGNEFKYNKSDTYRIKKQNMNRYLDDPVFSGVLSRAKVSGLKNRLILFCLKNHCLLPMYIYGSIITARG